MVFWAFPQSGGFPWLSGLPVPCVMGFGLYSGQSCVYLVLPGEGLGPTQELLRNYLPNNIKLSQERETCGDPTVQAA